MKKSLIEGIDPGGGVGTQESGADLPDPKGIKDTCHASEPAEDFQGRRRRRRRRRGEARRAGGGWDGRMGTVEQ